MFQFSGFAHLSVYYVFNIVGCPIQVFTDQSVCASPRNFSQLITPFIASESQGIPHTPLFCLLYSFKDAINRIFFKTRWIASLHFLNFLISICQWTFSPLQLPQRGRVSILNPSPLGRSGGALWRITESNRWPPACKAGALASWANPPISILDFWIQILDFWCSWYLLSLVNSNF